ncbi:short-chain dehydrogenase/reductase SDR [Nitzschia inconspicua]|uniref:Short-chain dehydrogenase/reductase SDR n=1 Tax=Nitzschia inconspicua TaxID=303405 RepID=A0A9K3KUF3_9STRA|nr:short-chain dehydrogenase/reductase SDR [Nitzschia inconspicua]
MVATAPVIGILSIPPLLFLLFRKSDNKHTAITTKPMTTTTTASNDWPVHVIVVGGSSGIGLSIAQECARNGTTAKVTILARNQDKLNQAKADIEETAKIASNSSVHVQAVSVSVTDYTAVEKIAHQLLGNNDKEKQPTKERVILFNCAGIPYTSEFETIPIDVYTKLVETNQLGAMYVTRAFLPHMNQGCIVFCSSATGQLGVYGYTVYSSTKFALRGFAETLHAELMRSKPGVSVQIAFPVDTATPGYEVETKMMPAITKVLNANAGLSQPEDIAKIMVRSAMAQNPTFQVYFTFEGWMLSNLTAGMSPVSNMSDAITQVALMGLFRLISLFYSNDFWRIIRNYSIDDDKTTTEKEEGEETINQKNNQKQDAKVD